MRRCKSVLLLCVLEVNGDWRLIIIRKLWCGHYSSILRVEYRIKINRCIIIAARADIRSLCSHTRRQQISSTGLTTMIRTRTETHWTAVGRNHRTMRRGTRSTTGENVGIITTVRIITVIVRVITVTVSSFIQLSHFGFLIS